MESKEAAAPWWIDKAATPRQSGCATEAERRSARGAVAQPNEAVAPVREKDDTDVETTRKLLLISTSGRAAT